MVGDFRYFRLLLAVNRNTENCIVQTNSFNKTFCDYFFAWHFK
ncbi:Uncharacterised protein [Mycobacteroides abscessus subsp. abscessus]|nr:Uncharacterised protein [Mycobacteroides abscessus subsp. abscessus]